MPAQKTVNLELQLKFLDQLQGAVTDALSRFEDVEADKLEALEYMDREVRRAKRIVNKRLAVDGEPVRLADRSKPAKTYDSDVEEVRSAAV